MDNMNGTRWVGGALTVLFVFVGSVFYALIDIVRLAVELAREARQG